MGTAYPTLSSASGQPALLLVGTPGGQRAADMRSEAAPPAAHVRAGVSSCACDRGAVPRVWRAPRPFHHQAHCQGTGQWVPYPTPVNLAPKAGGRAG